MIKYRVLVRGENFFLSVHGQPDLYGFYQTLYVEAEDSEQAQSQAIQLVRRSDLAEHIQRNEESDPRLYIDEIEYVESFDGVGELIQGRSFFPMIEHKRHWWQVWKIFDRTRMDAVKLRTEQSND